MMSMRSSGRSSGGRSSSSRFIGASASSIRPLGLRPSAKSMGFHSLVGDSDDDDLVGCHLDDMDACYEDSGGYGEDCEEIAEIDEVEIGCDAGEVEECEVDTVEAATTPHVVDTFDQNESIHNLVEALIQADASLQDQAEDFVTRAKLTVKAISSWTDSQRAKAYYFVMKLRYYGLNFDKFYSALAKRPVDTDLLALAWYNLAKKEAGIPYDKPAVGLSQQGVEASYVLWKFGLDNKPDQQPWSLVP
jgi:hypothetical protein